ncbi:MAG: hypothetical protein NTV54_08410, partial [Ignavibacteriales bacterium]|nr:hypothetical protein [Ignavibacteriales bacterium]
MNRSSIRYILLIHKFWHQFCLLVWLLFWNGLLFSMEHPVSGFSRDSTVHASWQTPPPSRLSAPPCSSLAYEEFRVRHESDSVFQLSKTFLIEKSERVLADSVILAHGVDYRLDYRRGHLIMLAPLSSKLGKGTATISIFYKYLPFTFRDQYRHKEVLLRTDSISKRQIAAMQTSRLFSLDDAFGSNIQKSGSIFRGFTLGTNRDMTLNSGFRLQFSGKLSDDVEVIAALTDENSPLQPEGNTQTLQEVDNVFVQVKSQNFSATLGDFYFDLAGGDFSKINRKLQGAQGTFRFENTRTSSSGVLAAATARGKFNSNQFAGLEGVQGPYQLYGKNNERSIIVIAGTDRVYLDGELLLRGESNDYSIDYGASEITFSAKRLVTSSSRIVVDFEYSDRNFTRNFTAVQNKTSLFDNKMELVASYVREGDDPNAPIDIALTEDDKELLRRGGMNGASKPGYAYVGIDSSTGLGKGQYLLADTVLSGDTMKYFVYYPSTARSVYVVSFSFVGAGKGDYARQSLGRYSFTGKGSGTYLPIIILPTPQMSQMAGLHAVVLPARDLEIDAEAAGTSFNANRFVSDGGATLTGGALNLKLQYAPKNLRIGTISLGDAQLTLSDRSVEKSFVPLDRLNDVEFS